ncbi:hypothetical protein [Serpens gallinarum]|uniref:Uncharacterized protein n=1 Tax=Serpens gallinarum TaxID=2763075 RepID=A0ABR8TJ39_9PSED|nr:hypothetical protein [Serpens gallinarum]
MANDAVHTHYRVLHAVGQPQHRSRSQPPRTGEDADQPCAEHRQPGMVMEHVPADSGTGPYFYLYLI